MGVIQAVRYAFINAKVRAMQSRLLGREGLLHVLEQASLEAIASALEDSEYSKTLGDDLVGFEVRLEERVLENAGKIKESMPGPGEEFYEKFLRKYEVESIESFLVELSAGLEREEAMRLIPWQHHHIFEGIEGPRDIIARLDLTAEYEEFRRTGSIVAIDRALNERYYSDLFASLPRDETQLRELLGVEVDIKNIKMALRYVLSGLRKGFRPLARGYEIPPWVLDDIVGSGSLDRAAVSLEGSAYYSPMVEMLSTYREEEKLQQVKLDNLLNSKCHEIMMEVPFGLAPIIAYNYIMEFEAKNLRAIVKLKAENFTVEEIRQNLVGIS